MNADTTEEHQVKTPVALPIAREANGRLLPGKSLNPGGQPAWVRAVQQSLRASAAKGALLVEQIIEGKPVVMAVDGEEISMTPSLEIRLKAAEIAFSYTIPKPKQELELSGSLTAARLDITKLSDEDLERAHQIARIARVNNDG